MNTQMGTCSAVTATCKLKPGCCRKLRHNFADITRLTQKEYERTAAAYEFSGCASKSTETCKAGREHMQLLLVVGFSLLCVHRVSTSPCKTCLHVQ